MDLLDLSASLKFLNHSGVCLNLEEKLQLELGIQQLLNNSVDHEFQELLFWGKIIGTNKDYFIALGVSYENHYEFPRKSFYWASSSDYNFKQFTPLNDQHRDDYDKMTGLITGDPNKVFKKIEKDKVEGEEEPEAIAPKEIDPLASSEEEDEAAKIVPVNLKEIDRIHYLVRAIETDCHVIPQGSFKLTHDHEVHRNEAFRGLKKDEAFQLSSYSHFRNVLQREKKEGIEKDDAVFQKNFLDDITVDKPQNAWSIQSDSTGTVAVLRNMVWPGFFGYHKVGSKTFGSVYIGDGIKNSDFPFMI